MKSTAAATPAHSGNRVVDLGAGVGAAGLAVAKRVAGIDLVLVEIDTGLADLARGNAAANAIAADVIVLDVTSAAGAFAAAGHPVMGPALDKRVEIMMGIYARHLVDLTIVLPGAVDVVSALAKARVKVAVVSNKPHPLTVEILGHYGFAPHLAAIQGADKALKTKPAPDMLLAALNVMGVKPSRALFVGDSSIDVATARNAGVRVWVLPYGYNMGQPIEACAPDRVIADCSVLLNS